MGVVVVGVFTSLFKPNSLLAYPHNDNSLPYLFRAELAVIATWFVLTVSRGAVDTARCVDNIGVVVTIVSRVRALPLGQRRVKNRGVKFGNQC